MTVARRTGWTPRELETFTTVEYEMLVSLLLDEDKGVK